VLHQLTARVRCAADLGGASALCSLVDGDPDAARARISTIEGIGEKRAAAVAGSVASIRGDSAAAREHFQRAYGAQQVQQPGWLERTYRSIFGEEASPPAEQPTEPTSAPPAAGTPPAATGPQSAPARPAAPPQSRGVGGALLDAATMAINPAQALSDRYQRQQRPETTMRPGLSEADRARYLNDLTQAAGRARTEEQRMRLRTRALELGLTETEVATILRQSSAPAPVGGP